jgi:4-alpha-glucanotransferase
MNKRGSGILLHVTSLPSLYGIGDLGPWAYRFADFLEETRQSYWQILPLSPTAPVYGNSPYSSVSTFAGNTLLISPDLLVRDGLIDDSILGEHSFPDERCDYDAVIDYKKTVLDHAYDSFVKKGTCRDRFDRFCLDNAFWLNNYSFFVAMKRRYDGRPWSEWPEGLRDRVPETMAAVQRECSADIEKEKLGQYLFFEQWKEIKDYCNNRGIQIVGDIPIYVSFDSADVWAHREIFKLDGEQRPIAVAGVPPDYFSSNGQLWGNPVYDWDALRQTGYAWWVERMGHSLRLCDLLRVDHFRGLVAYWEVPVQEKDAITGCWVKVPTDDFFERLYGSFLSLPLIAEDLGVITPDVSETITRLGLPGMKILLFAFGEDNPMHVYLPHTYGRNCVVYTGTHDNTTARGWFDREARLEDKERLFRYVGRIIHSQEVNWELIRLAMMSVADTAIFPMQDILGLGHEAQMNKPSVTHGNWAWRFLPELLTGAITDQLRSMTETYGRRHSPFSSDKD